MGRLAGLALLFAVSGIAAPSNAGVPASPPVHGDMAMDDGGQACEHAAHHRASSPSVPPAGDHGCHCVTPGLCGLAVPVVVTAVGPIATAGNHPRPLSAAGTALASVSPPQKPPRA